MNPVALLQAYRNIRTNNQLQQTLAIHPKHSTATPKPQDSPESVFFSLEHLNPVLSSVATGQNLTVNAAEASEQAEHYEHETLPELLFKEVGPILIPSSCEN